VRRHVLPFLRLVPGILGRLRFGGGLDGFLRDGMSLRFPRNQVSRIGRAGRRQSGGLRVSGANGFPSMIRCYFADADAAAAATIRRESCFAKSSFLLLCSTYGLPSCPLLLCFLPGLGGLSAPSFYLGFVL